MKDKKYKYYEDLVEEYLQLSKEHMEIPRLIEKNKEKLEALITDKSGVMLKSGEANDAYKLFLQIKKFEDRKIELETEFNEVQDLLKQFLRSVGGGKLPYKERDDDDKTKTTYSFWMEEDNIKSDR